MEHFYFIDCLNMPTLYRICLSYTIKESGTILAYYESRNIDIANLISGIPATVCEDLINACPPALMMPFMLHNLLKPGIKKLNLTGYRHELSTKDLEVVFKSVQYLNLSSTRISSRTLEELTSRVSYIACLILNHTQCNDAVLSNISKNCHFLERLDISVCSITDTGLKTLCCRHKSKRRGQHLKVLSVYQNRITPEGLTHLLEHLPLQDINVERHLYLRMLKCYISRNFGKTCRLRRLVIEEEDRRDLEDILLICPELESLSLFNVPVTDDDIVNMPPLKNLRILELVVSRNCKSLTFDKAVLYCLITSGHKLLVLTLINISYVNIYLIGRYCENLRELHLLRIHHLHFRFEDADCSQVFKHLKKIIIKETRGSIWENSLKYLCMNSPNLEHIRFETVPCVTDEIISEIVPYLNALECLELYNCKIKNVSSLYLIIDGIHSLKRFTILVKENFLTKREEIELVDFLNRKERLLRFNFNCRKGRRKYTN